MLTPTRSSRVLFAALCLCLCLCGRDSPTSPTVSRDEFLFSWEFLDIFYLFREDLPENPFAFRTPQALYESVSDPYTEYVPPDSVRQLLQGLTTQSAGIGISLDSVTNGYVIVRIIPSSPAEQAGLEPNDTLLSVNGSSVAGLSYDLLSSTLRGRPGEQRHLRIKRGEEIFTVRVTIAEFLMPSVYADTIDESTAYIYLGAFFQETILPGGSAQEFDVALRETQWAEVTILDVRGNPGGEVSQCIAITSEFVRPGTPLVRTTERRYDAQGDSGITVDTTWLSIDVGGNALNRRFIVVIDGGSASATEILVTSLKANRPDIVTVGSTTYGKARGQILAYTPDSGLVKVTFARLVPLSGQDYDLVGISPEVPVSPATDPLAVAVDLAEEGLAKSGGADQRSRVVLLGKRAEQSRTKRNAFLYRWKE